MGLCNFNESCWNSHDLTREQVERAIAAEKGQKVRDEDSDRKSERKRDTSRSREQNREKEEKQRDDDRNKKPICAKFLMGLCNYNERCWNSHDLTREQVERAIAAEKGRKVREDSDRKSDTSRNRDEERDEDRKKREFLEVYRLWEESQERKSKN